MVKTGYVAMSAEQRRVLSCLHASVCVCVFRETLRGDCVDRKTRHYQQYQFLYALCLSLVPSPLPETECTFNSITNGENHSGIIVMIHMDFFFAGE